MSNRKKIPFKQRLNAWLDFRKKMFQLWWYDAPVYQKNLEKGIYYLRKGAVYQVGQPFTVIDPITKRRRFRYISNLFYNFKLNKVTHSFSRQPIEGHSDFFTKPKK